MFLVHNTTNVNCNRITIIFITTLFKNAFEKFNGPSRLNGAALSKVHRDSKVEIDDIVDELAKTSKRKMNIYLRIIVI